MLYHSVLFGSVNLEKNTKLIIHIVISSVPLEGVVKGTSCLLSAVSIRRVTTILLFFSKYYVKTALLSQ